MQVPPQLVDSEVDGGVCFFVSFQAILDEEPRPLEKIVMSKVVILKKVQNETRESILSESSNEDQCYPAVRSIRNGNESF